MSAPIGWLILSRLVGAWNLNAPMLDSGQITDDLFSVRRMGPCLGFDTGGNDPRRRIIKKYHTAVGPTGQ
jgi:hypothetical protein